MRKTDVFCGKALLDQLVILEDLMFEKIPDPNKIAPTVDASRK